MNLTAETANYTWVVARINTKAPYGKSVVNHADQGIGYYVFRHNGDEAEVGFMWAWGAGEDKPPLPHHLRKAVSFEVEKLEKWKNGH